jgi:hypothetical protein
MNKKCYDGSGRGLTEVISCHLDRERLKKSWTNLSGHPAGERYRNAILLGNFRKVRTSSLYRTLLLTPFRVHPIGLDVRTPVLVRGLYRHLSILKVSETVSASILKLKAPITEPVAMFLQRLHCTGRGNIPFSYRAYPHSEIKS